MNTLQHADGCPRRRPPVLRLSWQRTPEVCPDYGRSTPADPPTARPAS